MKRRLVVLVSLVLLSLVRGGGAGVAAAEDPREIDARAKFALADYQGAAQLFARLYAESGEPIYLRNIGRCFQMMGESQKAIVSFEEYLRKARRVSDAERAEIRGFIDELRRPAGATPHRPPAAAPAPAPVPVRSPVPARAPVPTPAVTPPPAPAPPPVSPPPLLMVDTKSAPARQPAPPFYRRWWFWTGVAATAVAITIVVAATGGFTQTDNAACPDGRRCNP